MDIQDLELSGIIAFDGTLHNPILTFLVYIII